MILLITSCELPSNMFRRKLFSYFCCLNYVNCCWSVLLALNAYIGLKRDQEKKRKKQKPPMVGRALGYSSNFWLPKNAESTLRSHRVWLCEPYTRSHVVSTAEKLGSTFSSLFSPSEYIFPPNVSFSFQSVNTSFRGRGSVLHHPFSVSEAG